MKKVILTGDRPTGKLHLGHFVGSLKNRVELQNSGEYNSYIMIADMQALTDNAKNPAKVRENVLEVALDYLAVGIDPAKSTIFIQSQIPALSELTMYYMNLVSLSRVLRNPTVKTEISQKGWDKSKELLWDSPLLVENSLDYKGTPAGFAMYPISQAADITAFKANVVPVGEDQLPVIEITHEVVRVFNKIYGKTLIEPEAVVPNDVKSRRLPGIDGNAKMSKSLGNGIYLSDDYETLKKKVMSMYTDPDHIHVSDRGKIEGNVVFTYLDVFAPDQAKVAELKEQYQRGGLGDVVVKKYLLEVLDEILSLIRKKRAELAKNPAAIYDMLREGSKKANIVAAQTLHEVRKAIGVEYFES
ncbi:MAG: tryptophan--tRNA ligase [Candidatus Nomurabacteria bacterium]|jgi:tryptophanyl-tRNA synthetase|nr:tryptophan--tRNA ligase [Candidatus Nomurabacteria bacterium]